MEQPSRIGIWRLEGGVLGLAWGSGRSGSCPSHYIGALIQEYFKAPVFAALAGSKLGSSWLIRSLQVLLESGSV